MRGIFWKGLILVFTFANSRCRAGKMYTALNSWYKVGCIAENIKDSDHYICDDYGNMRCLPGWKNPKKHCMIPVCNPACPYPKGNCTAPNVCECSVGWAGADCSECVCLPGCHPQHGYCDGPFECKCKPGWGGMYCDKPDCSKTCVHGDCNRPGECNCYPGWTGPNCDQCEKSPGCQYGYCTKPMECICDQGYGGTFCHSPICRDGCNHTTGWCTKPNECWCHIGWTGPKCETCVPYPGCQNGFCTKPWECICTGDFTGMLCDKQKTPSPPPVIINTGSTPSGSPFGGVFPGTRALDSSTPSFLIDEEPLGLSENVDDFLDGNENQQILTSET